MTLSKNTYQGLLGISTTSLSGIWDIDEAIYKLFPIPDTPNIISSSVSIQSNTINLGSVNSGNLIVIYTEKGGSDINNNPPTGFTTLLLDNGTNPRMAIYTKIATGTENTITGDWDVSASLVLDGIVSILGLPQSDTSTLSTNISTATGIEVLPGSLVTFLTVCNNNNTVSTPPTGWTQLQYANGSSRELYLYTNEYVNGGPTGSVTAVWTGNPTNSILISFVR